MQLNIDVEPRIEETEVHLGPLQHEPVLMLRVTAEPDENDHPAVGEGVDAHHAAERPHEEVGVEMLAGEVLARPPVAPRPEGVDHRP